MIRAMNIASTGMVAQQHRIDNVANNLANEATTGYKRTRVEFQDLMYLTTRPAGTTLSSGGQVPVGLYSGLGTIASATQRLFTQGTLNQTGGGLDAAIEGEGFFQVTLPDGTTAYSRDGSFKRDANGAILTSDGYFLNPSISIPSNATNVVIASDGRVSVNVPGSSTPQQVGQITLARFANTPGLECIGRNLFVETAASGTPTTGNPTASGLGSLRQGFLESSNVQVVDEMVDMISAQRAYEINAKVVQGADQMMSVVAELKR